MLLRLGQFACVIAFFAICGGHWAMLQTVAWTQMLRDYSEESGIVAAIQQTFSGERPCSMCVNITDARQKESQSPAMLALAKKFEISLTQNPATPDPVVSQSPRFDHEDRHFPARGFAPPVPVPRILFT